MTTPPVNTTSSESSESTRLTGIKRIKFLFWFSRCDLLERRALPISFTMAFSICVVTAAVICVGTLGQGYQQLEHYRLKEKKAALCLWVGDKNKQPRQFTDRTIDELRVNIQENLENPEALEDVQSFRLIRPRCETLDGQEQFPTVVGRTWTAGDGFFDDWDFHSGRMLKPEEEAVVITPRLARKLAWSEDAINENRWPESVNFLNRSGRVSRLPVVGVAEDLPLGLSFVVTETYFRDSFWPNPRAEIVASGPLPADWPHEFSNGILPQELQFALEDFRLQPVPAPEWQGDQPIWVLSSTRPDPPRLIDWRSTLEGIEGAMRGEGFSKGKDFSTKFQPRRLTGLTPPPEARDYVALYFSEVTALPEADRAISSSWVILNRDVILQLEEIGEAARIARVILAIFLIIIAVMALCSCLVLQFLRSRQKLSEVAMLKALGLPRGLASQLYLTEGLILAVIGALFGAAFAYGFCEFIASCGLVDTPAEKAELLKRREFWCGLVFCGSALMFAVSTYLMTLLSHRGPATRNLTAP